MNQTVKIFLAALVLLPAPAFAQYDVDIDPCASSSMKEFLQGKFVVSGYKKAAGVPDQKDMYAGAAEVELKGCSLIVKRCVGGDTGVGEIKKIAALADKIPMWMAEIKDSSGTRKYYFQMATDLDNYPFLYGWGEGVREFWAPSPQGEASCASPA